MVEVSAVVVVGVPVVDVVGSMVVEITTELVEIVGDVSLAAAGSLDVQAVNARKNKIATPGMSLIPDRRSNRILSSLASVAPPEPAWT